MLRSYLYPSYQNGGTVTITKMWNSNIVAVDVDEYVVISVYEFLSVGHVFACERSV